MTPRISRSAFLLFLLTGMTALCHAQGPTPAGVVIHADGEVRVMRDNAAGVLQRRDRVHSGDQITTGKDSRARLRMLDGTILTLGDNTVMAIGHYVYTDQGNTGSAQIEFLKGAMRALTGAIGKTGKRDFAVHTPVGVIGIRGTDFWVGTALAGVLEVALISGRGVYVANAAGRVEIARPGDGTTVKDANLAPTRPKRWGERKYHAALASVAIDED